MFKEDAINVAEPFLNYEKYILSNLLSNLDPNIKILVIGAGNNQYQNLVNKYKLNYSGLEPFYTSPDHSESIIKLDFENFDRHNFTEGNTFFIFWFNVAFYINSIEKHIERLVNPGDILFFSGWSNSQKAKRIMAEYFSQVFVDVDVDSHVLKINEFYLNQILKTWKEEQAIRHEKFSNNICNIDIFFA